MCFTVVINLQVQIYLQEIQFQINNAKAACINRSKKKQPPNSFDKLRSDHLEHSYRFHPHFFVKARLVHSAEHHKIRESGLRYLKM